MGLGQGERAERLAREHRRQPSGALLVRAPGHDRVLRQDVDRERHRGRHVGRAELLHDQRPGEVAEPGASDGLGDRRGGEAQLAHPGEDRPVEPLGLVALDRRRGDLTLRELAGGPLEQALLGGERAAHCASLG